MEQNSWTGNWAFTLNNVKEIDSVSSERIDKYGDGNNLLFERIEVINSALATNTSGRYSYNMTINSSTQPIFMICAPSAETGGFTGVNITNYYIEY